MSSPRSQPNPTSRPEELSVSGRILVAEDVPDSQRLIMYILRKAGAEVTIAGNGRMAVETALRAEADGAPFDLILMDMQMPVMDGYEATAQLRSRGYTRPIVALTAHFLATERDVCLSAGCDDFLNKPFDRAPFLEMVARHCNAARAQTPEARRVG